MDLKLGKYLTVAGIGMTCEYSYDGGSLKSGSGGVKYYPDLVTNPNRNTGFNIVQVNSTTSFTLNVGVSTVPTFYHSGGHVYSSFS